MSGIRAGAKLRTRSIQLVSVGALVLAGGLVSTASTAAGPAPDGAAASEGRAAQTETRGFYDARTGTSTAATARSQRVAGRTADRPATRALRASLGSEGLFEIDGSTGTVRVLESLRGTLTKASGAAAPTVAMRYVSHHLAGLGLTRADLETFHLRRNYRDVSGTRHLSWTQRVGGKPVFGNGLQAAVDGRGRLLMVGGSPVSGASAPARTSGK